MSCPARCAPCAPQMALPTNRDHFDVVVACEDENDEDLDVPLVSIKWR